MCRNIKTLYNFDPPASEDEIRAASLQFIRKLSGFNKPSKANAIVFDAAIESVARIAQELLDSLETNAKPRTREIESAKAKNTSSQEIRLSRRRMTHIPIATFPEP